jgi:nucleotide-binding universal stress UspA family protein
MARFLVAVDGSDHAIRAVKHLLRVASDSKESVEAHILNVQSPIAIGGIKRAVTQEMIDDYYRDEGNQVLNSVRQLLDKSSIPHTYHIGIGPIAETIIDYGREHSCTHIIIGSRGLGSLSSLLLGSVANKVLHLAEVPVTVVK